MTSTNATSPRRLWVYKCNRHSEVGGDWHEFFSGSWSNAVEWGGTWTTQSAHAKRALQGVRAGDLIVCYQSDERAVIGLARVDRAKRRGDEISLMLRPEEAFHPPFRTNGRADIKEVRAFRRGAEGSSMFGSTTTTEARKLLRIFGAKARLK